MATTRITQKISDVVRRQFPEHVQSDYNKFIQFVEAYYQFLEQDQEAVELLQNARSYKDIDLTADSFVNYFLKQYAPNIPYGVLADQALLIKQIKQFYESKGSALSFDLLFRVLFDTTVDIKYPYENVLRASDGIWQQKVSVRVLTVSGSTSDLKNRYLRLEKNGLIYNTPILSTKRLSSSLTELFLDTSGLGNYAVNDTVTVSNGTSVIFTGKISPTTTGYTILSGGSGFKVGQIYTINYAGAVNTLVKVSKVNSTTGAIEELKFINFGYGFTNSFETNLDPTKSVSSTIDYYLSKTGGFGDVGQVWLSSPTDPTRYFLTDYVESSYSGSLSKTWDDSYTVSAETSLETDNANIANIRFNLGALGRYPGTYTSNKGFLSDDEIRLEDDKLYQPFAYQTNTEIDITTFYDVVKKLIHPAGQQLYNNRTIYNAVDLSSNVSVVSSANIFEELASIIEIDDSRFSLMSSTKSDTVSTATTNIYTLTKPLSSNTTASDSEVYALAKSVTDTADAVDETVLQIGTVLSDVQELLDSQTWALNKVINNADSQVSLTESVTAEVPDYAEAGFFAENYAASTITLL